MPKVDRVLLNDMLDSSREIQLLWSGKGRTDLDKDRMLPLSLERLLEIVGEAASHVSVEFRERHPEVPWRDIVAMRNRLIHAYRSVDPDIVWTTVQGAIPDLIDGIEDLLNERGTR
jgi:uncharacterized protein with HEPN domain